MHIFIHRPVVVTVLADLTDAGGEVAELFLRPGTVLRVAGGFGGGVLLLDGLGWARVPRNAYTPAAPPVGCFSVN